MKKMLTATAPNQVTQQISRKNSKIVLSAAEKRQHSPGEESNKKEKKEKERSPTTTTIKEKLSRLRQSKLGKSDKSRKGR